MGQTESQPGVKVTRTCSKCHHQFETTEEVVTIKGPTPPQTTCPACRDQILNEVAKRLEATWHQT